MNLVWEAVLSDGTATRRGDAHQKEGKRGGEL